MSRRSKILALAIACSAIIIVGGCKTPQPPATRPAEVDWSFPANYSKENYRKLLLAVYVPNIEMDPNMQASIRSLAPAEMLSGRLQTEMAKLRRFTVFSQFLRDGVPWYIQQDPLGGAKFPEVQRVNLDLVLTVTLSPSFSP